jgi:hypothetical protein
MILLVTILALAVWAIGIAMAIHGICEEDWPFVILGAVLIFVGAFSNGAAAAMRAEEKCDGQRYKSVTVNSVTIKPDHGYVCVTR